MIIVTGDIHHMSLKTRDQGLLPADESELSVCERYLNIANKYEIVPTIYATGKIAEQEGDRLAVLCKNYSFELGGHTYNCYKPRIFYGLSRRVAGRANGPAVLQRWDVRKTIELLANCSGKDIISWRNHAYRQDINTAYILYESGIQSISNEVDRRGAPRRHDEFPVAILPINIVPDHENLRHYTGVRTDSIGSWLDKVKRDIEKNEDAGAASVLLAHPACMGIEDDMRTFGELMRFVSGFETMTAGEYSTRLLEGLH